MKENNVGIQRPVTIENALEYLRLSNESSIVNYQVFDEYGNYSFPTDFDGVTHNFASGTTEGVNFCGKY